MSYFSTMYLQQLNKNIFFLENKTVGIKKSPVTCPEISGLDWVVCHRVLIIQVFRIFSKILVWGM